MQPLPNANEEGKILEEKNKSPEGASTSTMEIAGTTAQQRGQN
jgi:hypothetical protein